MNKLKILFPLLLMTVVLLLPELGFCSVESTLAVMQSKLIVTILPLVSVLGLVVAGFSFVMGSPNARAHLTLAIMGAVIGFGAPSIISFIRGVVQ